MSQCSCQFYQWNVIKCLRMPVVFKVLLYMYYFCTLYISFSCTFFEPNYDSLILETPDNSRPEPE